MFSVGAVDVNDQIASFSSDGPTADGRVKPEVLSRGANAWVVSAGNDTNYRQVSGTSAATPLVAGAVACIVQKRPGWSVATMRSNVIGSSSYYLAHGTHDPLFVEGYGIIDALLASDATTSLPDPASPNDRVQRAWPNPFRSGTAISYSLDAAGEVRLELFDPRGRRVRTVDGGDRPAGPGRLALSGADLPAGLYLYRVLAGREEISAGKLLHLDGPAN